MQRADDLGDESARPWLLVLARRSRAGARRLGRHSISRAKGTRLPNSRGSRSLPGSASRSRALSRRSWDAPRSERWLSDAPSRSSQVDTYAKLVVAAALGHLELVGSGPERRSIRRSSPPSPSCGRRRIVEPTATRFVADQTEALIELGRREEAVELLGWYEDNARRVERVSAIANCARCRGLLVAQADSSRPRSLRSRRRSRGIRRSSFRLTAGVLCSRSAPRSVGRSGVGKPARRSKKRSRRSSGSAPRCGRSVREPSSSASAAARRRRARSPPPRSA